jgi:hypothetical protein
MNSKPKADLCAYCGVTTKETVDHIPPKLFFDPPYPNNFLTVPACRKCNKSFQADDEYTRFVVTIDFRAQKNATAQLKLPAVLRSLQRPKAKPFSEYLLNQMSSSIVLGADGNPMGQLVEVEKNRIDATGARLVRGLYYVEKGEILGQPKEFRIASRAGVTEKDPAIQQFARMYASSTDHRTGEVGEAFSYAACFHPTFSIWFLFLYSYFSWLATIRPHDATK